MVLTASEASVFGTATSSSDDAAPEPDEAEQCAKEQKFMVLTSSICNIHGWGRVSGVGSNGSLVLSRLSSSALNFQTTSVLSLPCLQLLVSVLCSQDLGRYRFGLAPVVPT